MEGSGIQILSFKQRPKFLRRCQERQRQSRTDREKDASKFVTKNHYLASYPQHTAAFGLYLGVKLVGVAVYSNPARSSGKRYGNVPQGQVQELSRLVLLDKIKSGAETYLLRESLQEFKRYYTTDKQTMGGGTRTPKRLSVIISHSDPLPVVNKKENKVVLPGHIGNIYQAHSMLYTGRSSKSYRYTTWDGRPIPVRSLTKIRAFLRGDTEKGAGGKKALEDLGKKVSKPLVKYIEANFESKGVANLVRDWLSSTEASCRSTYTPATSSTSGSLETGT